MAEPSRTAPKSMAGLRVPIMLPLAVGLSLLLAGVVFGAYLYDREQIQREVSARVAEIDHIRDTHVHEDLDLMDAALLAIAQDGTFARALANRDREALLEMSTPLFLRLRNGARVTHFYFTDRDRVNIVRVHKPDRYGDVIDRFTTLEAERTKAPTRGIELGPLGTLTMRVVHPCFEEGELVGFMELGHEMQHLIDFLREVREYEVFALIQKTQLDREGWASGMSMLGREVQWDRFPDYVATGEIPEDLPADLLALLSEDGPALQPDAGGSTGGGSLRRWALLPMVDAADQDIGWLVVVVDTTDRVAQSTRFLFTVALAFLSAGTLLAAVLFVQLGRIEKRLRAAS